MPTLIALIQLGFVSLIMLLIYMNTLPVGVGYLYFLTSGFTFSIYGWDKRAAIKQNQRIPELHLHFLALVGGWPGAILGQKLFRHKTLKPQFRRWFHLSWLMNSAILLVYIGLKWQNELVSFINHLA